MKKNKKVFIVLIATLILCVSCFFQLPKLRADSGFDSSYSGGSSSSSSSSSSSGSSSSSYSSSDDSSSSSSSTRSTGDRIFTFIIMIGAVTFFLCLPIIGRKKVSQDNNKVPNIRNLSNEQINKIIPGFNSDEFIKDAFNIYKSVQIAWMNFDLENVRDILTDEIYNMYTSQLMTLKIKHEKNMMSDFNLIDANITGCHVANGNATMTTVMTISFYDYIINDDTKVVLRGRDDQKMMITYEMTFTKKLKDVKAANFCPNCGSPVAINTSGICEYCNSVIVNENTKWVLAKKKNLFQK